MQALCQRAYNRPMTRFVVIDSDAESRQAVENIMKIFGPGVSCRAGPFPADEAGPSDLYFWLGFKDEKPPAAVRPQNRFVKPLRAGVLLERIHTCRAERSGTPEKITFGDYTLNTVSGELHDGRSEKTLRLTEKESRILAALQGAQDRRLGRRELMEKVWGYGEEIETHTLETHIYRLRQKIESDPAKPLLLLTDETGYRLAV